MKKTITTLALANCLLSFPGVQAMDAVQSADLAPVVVLREVEDQQDRKIAEAPRLEIPVVPIEAPTPALTNLKDGCGYLLLGALNGGKAVVSVVDAATNFLGGAFNAVAGVANYIRAVSAESDADRVALLKSADTNLTGPKTTWFKPITPDIMRLQMRWAL